MAVLAAGLPDIQILAREDATTSSTAHVDTTYGNDGPSVTISNERDEYVINQSLKAKTSRAIDLLKSSIYGNADTVQPPAITMGYYIKY